MELALSRTPPQVHDVTYVCFRLPGRLLAPLLAAAAIGLPARASPPPPLASGVWESGGEPLRWQAGRRFAGAISSIRYRNREFLDAADHGRVLQGAVQFGQGECLNPTLAGASDDPPGQSSSQLLSLQAGPALYRASTRMAFWNRPGERCALAPGERARALNRGRVSDLVYSQQMRPGYQGHARAILVRVEIRNPRPGPPASVEALTGYMPPAFDRFFVYDAATEDFHPDDALAAQSGERDEPLVLSTADGRSAMGVVGLPGETQPRYAGFHSDAVGKWSVVYHEAAPFASGVHLYDCVWIIGSRREVEDTLADIVRQRTAHLALEEAVWAGGAAAALLLGAVWLVRRERRRRRRPLLPL